MKHVLFCLVVFTLFCFFGGVDSAFAATNVSGIISTDTVWNASSSPYIATDKIFVAAGATLTLEKGVVVKLRTKGIEVEGTLRSQGTESDPVFFTAQTDDTVGGDSNSDGAATLPAAGAWQGIQFDAGSSGNFEHTFLKYAGFSRTGVSGVPLISAIHNLGGTIEIRNTVFTDSPSCAIGQGSGELIFENGTTDRVACGVVALGGVVAVRNNTFNFTNSGLFINGAHTIEVTGNTFIGGPTTADITLTPVTSFISHSNTASVGQLRGMILRGVIGVDLTLIKDSLPYIVSGTGGTRGLGGFSVTTDGNLTVGSGRTLSVSAGSVFKFTETARLIVDGVLHLDGSETESLYFTSLKDDTVGGDTNGDAGATLPARGDWNHVLFNPGSAGVLTDTVIRYGGRNVNTSSLANIYNNGGELLFTSGEIAFGGQYGLRHMAGTSTVTDSFIHDNLQYGVSNATGKEVNAINNYWNDPTGPKHVTNPAGLGDRVSDKVLFTPWKTTNCFVNCYSNVLFLPGIQASRLYKDTLLGEDQVWPPNAFNNEDVQDLSMTAEGVSKNNIYTRDIIDTSIGVGSVYGGFTNFMDQLKTDGLIAHWKPYAYDWRYSVTDIAKNGTHYQEGTRFAINELTQLASTSRTGHVTIVGHSNGGLLAKAIMRELEVQGKAGLVDKVVFIASPQLGTPKAIGTILHGYDQTDKIGGTIINAQNAREVINNLPGAYGLLPSAKYFEGQTEPIVTFADGGVTSPYQSVYGNTVTSYANYVSFVRGIDSQPRDIDSHVSTPARANSIMLNEGFAMHDNELDTWVAPSGVEVIEIVGTGLPTMKAVEYREVVEKVCGIVCADVATLKPYAVLTHYGDETVVQRSAEGYGGVKEKYFFNIKAFEKYLDTNGGNDISHYNITEAFPLQDLVKEVLLSSTTQSNQFISTTHTEFNDFYDVEIIDSPVRLLATDTQGNETGVVLVDGVRKIKKDIPGSQYFEFGDTKYFVVPKGTNRTTKLYGEDYGGYTLTTAELTSADSQVIKTELKNASTTPQMVAEYSNVGGTFSTVVNDINGDGVVDFETTLTGEKVVDEPEVTYTLLITKVESLSLSKLRKQALLLAIRSAEFYANKKPSTQISRKLEDGLLDGVKELIRLYVKKKYLTSAEAIPLIETVQVLKDKQ